MVDKRVDTTQSASVTELFPSIAFNKKFKANSVESLREFLNKLRGASPVNMLQSEPFLYSGREWIDRYYGEDQEDNEDFQEVLEMADEAKDKMIQGVLKYMESEGIEIELDKVNRLMGRFASKILQLYISFV